MTVVVADSSPLNYLTLIGSDWALNLPAWVDVRVALEINEAGLLHLDPGERAAISLAQSEPGALLLIDDAAGRIEAARRGIAATGTLGVLRAAALKGLVDLPTALGHLLQSNFRISMSLVTELLEEDAERRRKPKGD